jgi:hypothetical protein
MGSETTTPFGFFSVVVVKVTTGITAENSEKESESSTKCESHSKSSATSSLCKIKIQTFIKKQHKQHSFDFFKVYIYFVGNYFFFKKSIFFVPGR